VTGWTGRMRGAATPGKTAQKCALMQTGKER